MMWQLYNKLGDLMKTLTTVASIFIYKDICFKNIVIVLTFIELIKFKILLITSSYASSYNPAKKTIQKKEWSVHLF